MANLVAEGVRRGVHLVGDVMYDVLLAHLEGARSRSRPEDFAVVSGGYVLVTVHRAGNTDDPQRFAEILEGLERIADAGISVVFPAHPRSRRLLPHGYPKNSRIHLVDPLSYEQSLMLAKEARAVGHRFGRPPKGGLLARHALRHLAWRDRVAGDS